MLNRPSQVPRKRGFCEARLIPAVMLAGLRSWKIDGIYKDIEFLIDAYMVLTHTPPIRKIQGSCSSRALSKPATRQICSCLSLINQRRRREFARQMFRFGADLGFICWVLHVDVVVVVAVMFIGD